MSWRFGSGRINFGSVGNQDYGPLAGRDPVVAQAVPSAVVHPGGSPTVINPGDNWDTKITTAGAGGTLWVVKGNHVHTSRSTPLVNQTFVIESAAGYNRTAADSAIIDGQNANFPAHLMAGVAGVTIRGGVFTRQGNSLGDADTWASAILQEIGATGWVIQDAIVNDNRNMGLSVQTDTDVQRCYLTGNGRYGISGGGSGVLMENTRISNNNTRNLDWGLAASAMKFAGGGGSYTIRKNWVHDNNGFGIWLDGMSAGGNVISENVCESNLNAGIFYEISGGSSSISRNWLDGNGELGPSSFGSGDTLGHWFNSPQLLISCSDGTIVGGDIDVTRNDIYAIERAMGLINHEQPHPFDSRRVQFHHNRVTMTNTAGFGGAGGQVGGFDAQAVKTLWTDTTNAFYANEYRVASSTFTYWKWNGPSPSNGDLLTWTQWLALGLNRGNPVDTRVLI